VQKRGNYEKGKGSPERAWGEKLLRRRGGGNVYKPFEEVKVIKDREKNCETAGEGGWAEGKEEVIFRDKQTKIIRARESTEY